MKLPLRARVVDSLYILGKIDDDPITGKDNSDLIQFPDIFCTTDELKSLGVSEDQLLKNVTAKPSSSGTSIRATNSSKYSLTPWNRQEARAGRTTCVNGGGRRSVRLDRDRGERNSISAVWSLSTRLSKLPSPRVKCTQDLECPRGEERRDCSRPKVACETLEMSSFPDKAILDVGQNHSRTNREVPVPRLTRRPNTSAQGIASASLSRGRRLIAKLDRPGGWFHAPDRCVPGRKWCYPRFLAARSGQRSVWPWAVLARYPASSSLVFSLCS